MTDTAQTQFNIASTYQEVLDCWRLVYKCYAHKGLIDTNPHAIHTYPQASNLDTVVIYGRTRGRIDTTLTVINDGPRHLPLDQVYPQILDQLRHRNRRLIEVSLFADDRDQVGHERTITFEAIRLAVYLGLHTQSSAVIGVHPHHSNFYARMLGFEVIGPVRSYPKVNNRLVVPLLMEKSALQRERLPRLLRYIKEHPVESSVFDQRFDFGKLDMLGSAIGRYLNDTTQAEKPRRFMANDVQMPAQRSAVL